MLPASLNGFLLSQLCSCFEVVKAAVHISLLSWTDSSQLRHRNVSFPTVVLSFTPGEQRLVIALLVAITIYRFYDYQIFISDLGHSTNSRRRPPDATCRINAASLFCDYSQ